MTDSEKVEALLGHIHRVQENCLKLGKKLMEQTEPNVYIGRQLIANSMLHDVSKFFGIEWDHLGKGDPMLGKAVAQHNRTNLHHPEYWGSIHKMPDVYIAEMVCDWKARSSEFGTNLQEWIKKTATKRFKFKMVPTDLVGLKIRTYLDLLLEEPFTA